jgi:predicted mannosyl-3-phosphoglycerate phosphatase (HAD superfamily)
MEKFLFLDLDDTVFQTRRKCSSLKEVTPAAFSLSGEPSSYFFPKQKVLLSLLQEQWRIIPTTARTLAAYNRVDLGFSCNNGVILNHGATIFLTNGQEDLQWRAKMERQLMPLYEVFEQLKQAIEQYAQQQEIDLLVRMINESGLTFYVEVRHRQAISEPLQATLMSCVHPLLEKHPEFKAYLNSNSLTILPRIVNKSHAVEYLLEKLKGQYGDIMTMGMGDSRSDAPFLALCDYVMIPQGTQLHQQLMVD